MKKIWFITIMWALLAACENKLDITPKGKTVLGTVDELETLLNQKYGLGDVTALGVVCNECYGTFVNVPTTLSTPMTLDYAYLAYDENINRAALTTTDDRYAAIYQKVNYMNVVINKLDDAEGDEAKKVRLAAEARVMRAYFHWLAVNIYAKQYDEATAETAGGVAYVTDLNVEKEKTKLTVAEVYRLILEDCSEEQIAHLPDVAPDVCRAGKAWGYAVRAKVLMQMKKYPEALACAEKSISYQSTLEDRSSVLANFGGYSVERTAPNNIIFMNNGMITFGEVLSVESAGLFEAGDYVRDYGDWLAGLDFGGDEDYDYDDDEDYNYDDEDYAGEDDGGEDGEDEGDDASSGDEEGTVDDDEGDEGDDYGDFVFDSAIWNATYGEEDCGVAGALEFYTFSVWGNTWGITVDRMYYTAAECYIRTGKINEGLRLVDEVRRLRIHPDNFQPFEGAATTEEDAMALLQPAKWIECVCTYENYFDCKRWNTEAKYRRTITRTIPGYGTYTLSPDSPLWVFPFPNSAVRYNPSLTQNY